VALWLKQEDANSKYYHTLASARRAHNHIPQVTIQPTNPTDPPTTVTHTPQIISEFIAFYKTILGTPSPGLLNLCLEALYPQPNPHFLRPLIDPISIREIKNVVFSLPKDKANGPDGLPIEFFQEYWEFISDDLHSMVMTFYHNRLDLWRINQAYITLIPKSTTPETLSDYRPISVLSAVPKILTKILATRLQPYLYGIISNNQTTFIKGRQLMQTFLSTRELLCHLVKNKITSIFMKIDFQKAFDSISWDFLLEVFRVRCFPPLWIVWMRSLLISSFLKINGLKGQSFYHRKGLRQDDLLSPLLFILTVDSL
jgi:Reverse transcriptase (RNA-dependent DNA polymerase)